MLSDIVRGVIDEWDPCALLAPGAPDDEYSAEASAIAARVGEIAPPEDAARVISEVFSHWMGPDRFPPEACTSVGHTLYRRLAPLGWVRRKRREAVCGWDERDEVFGAVRQAIDEWDPYGLLDMGAPKDEYFAMIADIASQVGCIDSPEDAARVTSEVFSRWFEPKGFEPANCAEVGQRMYDALTEHEPYDESEPERNWGQRLLSCVKPVVFCLAILLLVPILMVLLLVGVFLGASRWAYAQDLRRKFERKWGRQRRRILLVYSESPNWQGYIEEKWLPRLRGRAVILNWSQRSTWMRDAPLEAAVHRRWGGDREFNPMAIYLPRKGKVQVVRFWKAFRDLKHDKAQTLRAAEAELFYLADELEGEGP
jgi:hypothetical protein